MDKKFQRGFSEFIDGLCYHLWNAGAWVIDRLDPSSVWTVLVLEFALLLCLILFGLLKEL